MLSLYVNETIPFCKMEYFYFPMVKISFPDQIQSVDFFYFSILMFTSVQSLVQRLSKANHRRKATSLNLDLFLSKAQKQHSIRKLRFSSDQMFINVNRSSWSTDCAAENSKPRVMLRDQRGDQPSKNWENLDLSSDSARILAFSSQYHTM